MHGQTPFLYDRRRNSSWEMPQSFRITLSSPTRISFAGTVTYMDLFRWHRDVYPSVCERHVTALLPHGLKAKLIAEDLDEVLSFYGS